MRRTLIILKVALFLFFAVGLLSSCSNKSDEEIEKELASAVVLVRCQSYYELQMQGRSSLYFSNYTDTEGLVGIVGDVDSVEMQVSYGTGFIVSDKGEIATNNHVVAQKVDENTVQHNLASQVRVAKNQLLDAYNEAKARYQEAQERCDYACWSPDVTVQEYNMECLFRDLLKDEMEEIREEYESLAYVDIQDVKLVFHSKISIAYNDTYVTEDGDFSPAVVAKTDGEHDLAIVQLKSKKTPADRTSIAIPDADPIVTYDLKDNITKHLDVDKNSKLYMCGFNLGPQLAITKEGVKSQFNNGSISQQTSERLMYSIPTLPGSSGSPVVNMRGELVAVNFAGITGTQGFNYGVRVKYLKQLMEK